MFVLLCRILECFCMLDLNRGCCDPPTVVLMVAHGDGAVMKCCSVQSFVHLFICFIGSALAVPSVTVKLHQPATLSCMRNCSAEVKWTVSYKPDHVLALCDQTSCRSEEGFQMSHDQYLQGELTLIITAAEFRNRNWYTCSCGGKDVCDVRLSIEALMSSVQLKPGADLILDLPVKEPLVLIYKSRNSSDPYDEEICTVHEDTLQCRSDYESRVALHHPYLTLRDLTTADCGLYSIRDADSNDIIHVNIVSMEERKSSTAIKQNNVAVLWIAIIVMVLLLMVMGLIVINAMWRRKIKQLQKEKWELKRGLKTCIGHAEPLRAQMEARSSSCMNLEQLVKNMSQVNQLISRYSSHTDQSAQSCPASNNPTVEEELRRKQEEMEEFLQRWNDHLNQWWMGRRGQLVRIKEQWRRQRVELQALKQISVDLQNDEAVIEQNNMVLHGAAQTSGRRATSGLRILKKIKQWMFYSTDPEENYQLHHGLNHGPETNLEAKVCSKSPSKLGTLS